jgi:hypothetical protein
VEVVYGGSGPNCTLERILQESILIEFYWECHVLIENGFYLEHRMVHHSLMDMTKTLAKLHQEYVKSSPHIFKPGRKAQCPIPDYMEQGRDELKNLKTAPVTKNTPTINHNRGEQADDGESGQNAGEVADELDDLFGELEAGDLMV